MRLNAALALLVTFLLLTVSSWADACDVSCSLPGYHSECSGPMKEMAQSHSSPSDMAMDMAMDMSGPHRAHETNKSEPGKKNPHPRMTPGCMNNACSEFAASAYPGKNASAALRQQAQCMIAAASLATLTRAPLFTADISPPQRFIAAPFLFTLRI